MHVIWLLSNENLQHQVCSKDFCSISHFLVNSHWLEKSSEVGVLITTSALSEVHCVPFCLKILCVKATIMADLHDKVNGSWLVALITLLDASELQYSATDINSADIH